MRYHLFQKFFGKMVKIKEMSFLSTRGMGLMFGNCTGRVLCSGTANGNYQITDFRLGISKKVSNIISITIKNT